MGAFNTTPWNGTPGAVPTGLITATNLIYGALRIIGVLRPGMGTSPENMADGFVALNDMVDSWNTERLTVISIRPDVYTLKANQASYQIGPGATDFEAQRPIKIERATLQIPAASDGPVDRPLELLSLAQYVSIGIKTTGSTIPTSLYYDGASPIGNLIFYPVPTVVTTFTLYTWQAIAGFDDLTTGYSFPPGYPLALRFNLAVQLLDQNVMGMKMPARVNRESIETKAREYKAAIKNLNLPAPVMSVDRALLGRQNGAVLGQPNILTGFY
jgi:hypothetical protein